MLQLRFGKLSTSDLGRLTRANRGSISTSAKDNREQGTEAVTNLLVNRTQTEMERRKVKGKGKEDKEKGPRGKGVAAEAAKTSALQLAVSPEVHSRLFHVRPRSVKHNMKQAQH